jgi:hypothetical protein
MTALTTQQAEAIREWATDAFEEAERAGYIRAPWHPTDDACEFMSACYRIGMTPVDAAEAMFANRH